MMAGNFPKTFLVATDDAGKRLDQFLTSQLAETSRARVQQLIAQEKVLVNDDAAKGSLRLRGGERISVLAEVELPPLRALAEDIWLDVVYEDDDLAVINKPAGMMVHAGAGATDDKRNMGTLVNALLHRFGKLSVMGGELRPGIVHRLDRETSGLIVVAKNDEAHRRLAAQFVRREVKKTYIALVHGLVKDARGTIARKIARDPVRRVRMTSRITPALSSPAMSSIGSQIKEGRNAVTHFQVMRKALSKSGEFTLLKVQIETGRTHQIRVHLADAGHPVVGDALYGAPRGLLSRNFLHAAELKFKHPRSGVDLEFARGLPHELEAFLDDIEETSGEM